MVSTLSRAVLLALLLIPALAFGQPGPGPFQPYGTPGSRQANAQDIIKALNGAVQASNGQSTGQKLFNPTLMGLDLSNPAIMVGNQGLPYVYGPNHIILPNNALQIDVAHPRASGRGLAVGASIQIGGGASYTSDGNGDPPVGPAVNGWNTNPAPSSSYGGFDSVGLVVANQSEPNPEVLPSVTISSATPNTVRAPLGQTFSQLTCAPGGVVELNTTPLLVGAVTGCDPTSTVLYVQGWEQHSPLGAAANQAPLQNPTTYTQGSPLTLTTLAPSHGFGLNVLMGLGGTGAMTQGTGAEFDMICNGGGTACNQDALDLFTVTDGSQTAVNIGGALTGGWAVGVNIAHAHYAGIHVDLSDESAGLIGTPYGPAATALLLDKKFSNFVVGRSSGAQTWGVDSLGNETLACPSGQTSGCGTLTTAGTIASAGLQVVSMNLGAYPLLVQAPSASGPVVNVLLLDRFGDLSIPGGLAVGGIVGASGYHTGPTAFASLGSCNAGDFQYVSDGKNADGTLGVMAWCNAAHAWYAAAGSAVSH